MQESNPFENKIVATEWVNIVEADTKGARAEKIYPLLKKWTTELHPHVLLEIGSGQGICSEHVNLNECKYIGVEPSQFLIDRAKELYPQENKTFLKGSAYDLPISSASVDAVFSVAVWFHLESLDKAHTELARVLKPEGKVLIITTNSDRNDAWVSLFKEGAQRTLNGIRGVIDVPHGTMSESVIFLHDKSEVVSSLQKHGIAVTSLEEFGVNRPLEGDNMWVAIEGVRR